MPVRQKGVKVETGIWKDLSGCWKYVAEVTYQCPKTGKRIREIDRFHRIDLARDWRRKQQEDALRGELRRSQEKGQPIPFEEFADEYLTNWSSVEKKPSSYGRDKYSAEHLKKYFGRKPITEITRRDVERYVGKRKKTLIGPKDNRRPLRPATVNRELCCLKNMLRKAVDWEYIPTNPAWGVKQSKENPPEFEFLTLEEADRVVKVCASHIKTFLILALNTGMRRGELFSLEWRDVDANKGQNGIITLRDTKNNETRHIPMNNRVREVLANHPRRIINGKKCPLILCNEEGKSYVNLRGSFETALVNAEITKHLRIHDLRHTFASHLTMKGIDLRTVAKLLGHRDIKVTMRYAHLAPDHLQAAVDVLTETNFEPQREVG
jgi:site-specific recombinase XerD